MSTEPLSYSSTQNTLCAVCGKDKHTPLRRDEMGGYVCLTCIDERLNELETALEDIWAVASGEKQVGMDDTDGMAWITDRASAVGGVI